MNAAGAVVIRAAEPSDLAQVEALLGASALTTDGVAGQFGPAYVVALGPQGMVGVAGVETHGGDGLLRSVAVAESWRGKGLGAVLSENRIEWARAQGLASLYLLTTTAADFFPRLGFERVARDSAPPAMQASREFAHSCPASAVVMRKRLA